MQKSRIRNALHPFISFLAAPTAEQGQCKTSSYGPTELHILPISGCSQLRCRLLSTFGCRFGHCWCHFEK